MEITGPVVNANAVPQFFPELSASGNKISRVVANRSWLLELDADGTIRYSNIHPDGADAKEPVTGTNFFELSQIGDIGSFRSDFSGFVKGDRNRQVFHIQNDSFEPGTAAVLTRSFDTTGGGSSSVVVLMELKKI